MGHEQNGQLYSLDIENDLHEDALTQRIKALEAMNTAEAALHYGGEVSGAEETLMLAEYSRQETKLLKLTSYCISKGLLPEDFEQAA